MKICVENMSAFLSDAFYPFLVDFSLGSPEAAIFRKKKPTLALFACFIGIRIDCITFKQCLPVYL
jgi:hypothetical protein